MIGLPHVLTEEQCQELDAERLRPAVTRLCERLGVPGARPEPFEEGSLPVYAVGEELVLKLYPPPYVDELRVESAALRALHGRLPVAVPEVRAAEVVEGWGVLLMDRLPGESLARAWPGLSAAERRRVVEFLGRALAATHAVPPPDDLGPADWATFVKDQAAGCVARQRELGTPAAWLRQIPDFLAAVELPAGPTVFLHTEFMPVHVHGRREGERWTVTGLLDFEPSMRGAREYDLVAVGLFVTRGDAGLLHAFLTAYGLEEREIAAIPRVAMAYTLLHRHCHLPWFSREIPPGDATTFDELAHRWFGVTAP
ncbi:phosphotransferase family protein [Streptomyces alkaliterrae]|uniref:Phosphotransferase n=1 Tax=Streptomyces alkaliterrae TaxID=2213162 RepID=A0A5P0YTD1_9ACTN|nr:aminoglycoside 3'-phosphotransferase/choline kinase family protein [Streptomyces alkaliterrae]MBB1252255.1 phosphotransferase [Streptomyces alkaliterrae]MBB1257939.1 phosphotransferase [Streptomyces alkaliterrae]MQS03555.1 phosphotransferase [Streptomyces alkaliterrae]